MKKKEECHNNDPNQVEAVDAFEKAADEFMAKLARANIKNPMEIRIINDQLMQLERVFLMVIF